MNKKEIYEHIVGAFENKYSWLGRQFGEEFLNTVASWNIQQFSNPDFRVRRHLLLFWGPGYIKCLDEDQTVLTNQGFVKLKDLQKQGKLITLENGEKIETDYIKSVLKKQNTYNIETISNYNVIAGEEHPFLVLRKNGDIEWVKTQELKPKDILIMAKPNISSNDSNIELEEQARLVGYLIGDGSYSYKTHFGFTNNNQTILNDYERLITKYFNVPKIHKYWRNNAFYYRINSKQIRQELKEKLGLEYNKTARNKSIPKLFMIPNQKIIENLIFGLFQTDGTYSSNGISICSTSKTILDQIRTLLLYIGVSSRTYTTNGNKFNLYILGSRNLQKLPILLQSKHGEKIQKIINRKNPASDVIPNGSRLILQKLTKRKGKGYENSIRKQFKKTGILRELFYKTNAKNRECFKQHLQKFNLEDLSWITSDNIFFEEIRHIKQVGIKNCYDLYVERTNTFITEGFYTHNSTMLMKARDILGTEACGHLSDVTTAAIRGSVDSGKFRVPVCLKHPFTVCTEFGQMINSGGDSNELVQKLLNILEEGMVTVSLIKAGGLIPLEREKAIQKYGIIFDDDNNFTYSTNWILMAGTYNKKFLADSALESRFIIMTPEKKLDGELTKYINRSGKFNVDEEVKKELREYLLSPWGNDDLKITLPDEVYSPEINLSVRESAGLISGIMAKQWWGFKTNKDDIIERAKTIKERSEEIWKSDEDKVFDCIFYEPKTIEEINKETGFSMRTIKRYLRNIRAAQNIRDGEYVYKVY